jgi:hypothetical protein
MFTHSLRELLSCSANSHLIEWNARGDTILVKQNKNATAWGKLLGSKFKSTKFNTFLRQLSYYGFLSSNNNEADESSFMHPHFTKARPLDAALIHRNDKAKQRALKQLEDFHSSGEKDGAANNLTSSLSGRLLRSPTFFTAGPALRRKNRHAPSASVTSRRSSPTIAANLPTKKQKVSKDRKKGKYGRQSTIIRCVYKYTQ